MGLSHEGGEWRTLLINFLTWKEQVWHTFYVRQLSLFFFLNKTMKYQNEHTVVLYLNFRLNKTYMVIKHQRVLNVVDLKLSPQQH